MKKTILLFSLFVMSTTFLFAQKMSVTGKVSDSSGGALPGVSILIQGTNNGTSTDFDGNYSINANKGDVLVFSFLGFKTKNATVTGANLNVSLTEDTNQLDEVVITALGISREKKSLGYAVQEVKGDDVNKGSESNVINTLSGKISGVQVQGTGNIGGSSRILLRGASSLTGNNQPLFVVDGVPVDNSNFGSGRQAYGSRDEINGNVDYGNSAQDINPDDIESVTVLKGANSAALYGSRAANGVILITTKKGKKNNGIGIDVSFSNSYETAYDFPDLQNEYGGGQSLDWSDYDIDSDGNPIQQVSTDESWGPKLDGKLVRQWDGDGNGGEVRPWIAHPNNYKDFFNVGQINKTSIAFGDSKEDINYRISYSNLNHQGIVPNSKINRNSFNVNLSGKISNLTVSTGLNFVNTKGVGRPKGGGSSDNLVYNMVIWTQRQLDINRLKDYEREDGSQRTWRTNTLDQTNVRANNPYWLAYKDFQDDEKNRFIGNIKAKYDFNEKLNISFKYGFDKYGDYRRDRRAVGSRYTPSFISKIYNFSEDNLDIIMQYNNSKLSNDLSLNINIGANYRNTVLESNSGATQGGLITEGIYSLQNSVDPAFITRGFSEKRTNSVYASSSLGYQNMFYLDLTARNDWSSTLPKDNWSYFYPSITGSMIFSKLIENDILSFGKIRAGWAQVGNDTGTYNLYNNYSSGNLVGGNPTFYIPSTLNNIDLKPEITTSFETGIEVAFFQNRLGIDLTYYTGNTTDQIMPITVSQTTGYTKKWVNAGEIKNSGIELQLSGSPLKSESFEWNLGVNWSKNSNEVIELAEGLDSYLMSNFYPNVTLESRVGEPFSSIYARKVARDPNGNMIVGADGFYVNGETEFIGSILPDWTSGINNIFRYKNISFSALIDIQKGGVLFGRGYQTALYAGTLEETAANGVRENGIIAEGVMINPDNPGTEENPNYITNTTKLVGSDVKQFFRLKRRNPGDFTVFDASFVKLREMSLQYQFSPKMFSKLFINKLSLAIVGRNLAILSRNTPNGYDPESAGNSSGNIQGREYGQLPSAKTIGMNIKISF